MSPPRLRGRGAIQEFTTCKTRLCLKQMGVFAPSKVKDCGCPRIASLLTSESDRSLIFKSRISLGIWENSRIFELCSKIVCISEIKINFYLFCISLDLHYLWRDNPAERLRVGELCSGMDRLHLRKTQINLVFHSICTIFAAIKRKKIWQQQF